MQKQAILVISFGTTHEEGRIHAVLPTLERIRDTYGKAFDIFEGFTSRIVMKRMKERGIHLESESELLERVLQEGYRSIIVQPLHLVGGQENNKMKRNMKEVAAKYEGVALTFGRPLLFYTGQEGEVPDDFQIFLEKAHEDFPVPAGEGVLYIGHGGLSPENAAYALLQLKALQQESLKHMRIATIECYPTVEDVALPWAFGEAPKKIHLFPLLFVAGDHVTNDIFGDEEESIKECLLAAGYEVVDHREALGSRRFVQDIYISHLEDAIQKRYLFKYDN